MRMKKLNLVVAAAIAAAYAIPGNSAPLEVGRNSITLDFSSYVNGADGQYVVKRSTGRVGDYRIIGRTTSSRFTDRKAKGNPYNYYYVVLKANGDTVASLQRHGRAVRAGRMDLRSVGQARGDKPRDQPAS